MADLEERPCINLLIILALHLQRSKSTHVLRGRVAGVGLGLKEKKQ